MTIKTLPQPLTHENIEDFQTLEFLMLIGPAGTGKSYSILSLARAWQRLEPEGKVYVIDTETGLAKTFKAQFRDVKNLSIWHGDQVSDMNKFLDIFSQLAPIVTPKDFLCLESDTRIWDYSQDGGWLQVTGQSKATYLSQRLTQGGPVTPHPDQLWQVALDSYRRRFRDVLVNDLRLRTNILITTGLTKPGPRVSAAKRETMKLLNIDVSPDGHSENSRNPDTVLLLSRDSDGYWAQVLKDRAADRPGETVSFKVNNFWFDFLSACRSRQ